MTDQSVPRRRGTGLPSGPGRAPRGQIGLSMGFALCRVPPGPKVRGSLGRGRSLRHLNEHGFPTTSCRTKHGRGVPHHPPQEGRPRSIACWYTSLQGCLFGGPWHMFAVLRRSKPGFRFWPPGRPGLYIQPHPFEQFISPSSIPSDSGVPGRSPSGTRPQGQVTELPNASG